MGSGYEPIKKISSSDGGRGLSAGGICLIQTQR